MSGSVQRPPDETVRVQAVQGFRDDERYCVWDRHGITHEPHQWRYAYTADDDEIRLGGVTCHGLAESEAGRPWPLRPTVGGGDEAAPADGVSSIGRDATQTGLGVSSGEWVERACELMHDAYEAAAKRHGWETQQQSRVSWADVPDANKATMRAAVAALWPLVREREQAAVEQALAAIERRWCNDGATFSLLGAVADLRRGLGGGT